MADRIEIRGRSCRVILRLIRAQDESKPNPQPRGKALVFFVVYLRANLIDFQELQQW